MASGSEQEVPHQRDKNMYTSILVPCISSRESVLLTATRNMLLRMM
jgi:hypothetical protein